MVDRSRFEQVTLQDGSWFFLHIVSETPAMLNGYEVNHEGEEKTGKDWDRRLRIIEKTLIAKRVTYHLDRTYAILKRFGQ